MYINLCPSGSNCRRLPYARHRLTDRPAQSPGGLGCNRLAYSHRQRPRRLMPLPGFFVCTWRLCTVQTEQLHHLPPEHYFARAPAAPSCWPVFRSGSPVPSMMLPPAVGPTATGPSAPAWPRELYAMVGLGKSARLTGCKTTAWQNEKKLGKNKKREAKLSVWQASVR